MPLPRVTVIIATYNWSTVLPYAIGSVLAQTMPDFELLVIGDGCTDDSEQVVAGIGDSRLRWINLPVNTGHQSGPNNRGLQEAKGEFIAYLGHDDLWLPHHLQCTTDALDGAGAAVARTMLMNLLPGQDTGIPSVLSADEAGPPTCTVYRRSVTDKIGGWRDYRTLDGTPENDLFLRARAAGFDDLFVPRLTAVKFPAAYRKNVYHERPCHEQSAWMHWIRSDEHFEPTHLVRMIVNDQVTRALPIRKLARILAELLGRRLTRRLQRNSGYRAVLWTAKGGGIDDHKKYKGLT
jgi:glycosyltransferase involved in cell wall biosynthesis